MRSKEQRRDQDLRRRYGISLEEYTQMFEAQEGRCRICRKEAELVVDHDHVSGEVRSLLCRVCNAALGMLQDSDILILQALIYIRRYSVVVRSVEDGAA